MGVLLNERRKNTAQRIDALRQELSDGQELCRGKACVYATGSFGRGEATEHSDLDLFIVGQSVENDKTGKKSSLLRRLDEILLKADLIAATRKLKIQDFSGDGEYLVHYSVGDLIGTLGKAEDDANNTFTARLLLLLESYPLLEESVYTDLTDEVISKYWLDYEDHKNDFIPAFLANDILRLWRTFCVNYEANTQREPKEKRAKRKLKNYKLKHSRLLTCYSALLYLLAIYRQESTVTPTNAAEMIRLTPTRRLEWLLSQSELREAHPKIQELLDCYERFLRSTDAPESTMIERFLDPGASRAYFRGASDLGNLVFDVLEKIGLNNAFHRLLVV
jgi:predicted nucleotidyltransferase